jgi:ABC-type glycerol-3-phosphate transport system substrate-binding protein
VWEGIKINGKIYAVPNQQIFPRGPGFTIPTQNIELLGLDVEEMKNWTLADYEKYMQAIKAVTLIGARAHQS